VDLVFVVDDVDPYVRHDDWVPALDGETITRTRRWGPWHERRFVTRSGLEVEAGFVIRRWTNTNPPDEGTRRVVSAGMRIVYDPFGLVAALRAACTPST
jgi:hypothetical protein